MEQFGSQAPKHEAMGWVYEQMQTDYGKGGEPEEGVEMGEKVIAMDADDLDAAHQNLKAAEAKKDPDLIRKWSNQTSQIAQKVIQSPQPKDADEVDTWKRSVDFAKQLDTYTEYSLFSGAMQTQDPRKRIDLADALSARNPKSQYLPALAELRFNAYRQLGDNAKALAAAEKTLETNQSSEDMLAFAATQYFAKYFNPDKVIAYSAKIVELMNTKATPEGANDAD